MKIAIMQPYLFPYLGYYQLASAVDTFVFFDDVNYIKKGWINKNNILVNGSAFKFSVPVIGISQNKLINEVALSEFDIWSNKFLKTLSSSYKKAPYFDNAIELISEVLCKKCHNVSELAQNSVALISSYLGLETAFIKSSDLNYDRTAAGGQQKILDICKVMNAVQYINPQNGRELYNKNEFTNQGLELSFISMNDVTYSQYTDKNFVPSLSIIDVLMFNSKEQIMEHLKNYILL